MDKKKNNHFFVHNKKPEGRNKIIDDKPKSKSKDNRQTVVDKNCSAEKKEDGGKKPFDKKAYRLKKYSKKYKLEQWEENRKKQLLYDYHKSIKNDPLLGSYKPKTFDEDIIDSNEPNVGKYVRHPGLIEKDTATNKEIQKRKKDPFQKAKEQYEKIKQEKIQKQEVLAKSRQERAQKIQEYKKKKQERFKKLSKKTKKGQPVMTGRLELMLDKIQNS